MLSHIYIEFGRLTSEVVKEEVKKQRRRRQLISSLSFLYITSLVNNTLQHGICSLKHQNNLMCIEDAE